MDKLIIKFIKAHHVLTLATVKENMAHTANMFYAFDENNAQVIFSSDLGTKHIEDGIENPNVAVNIVLETKVVGNVCGLQSNGILIKLEGEELRDAKRIYLKKFPYAALMSLVLWSVKFEVIKLTDNKLGFGKKLHWRREE